MLETILSAAVEMYNRYREPVATATVLEYAPEEFRVRFEGSFCTTCCRDDYFDDLRYELTEYGVPVEAISVDRIEQTGHEQFTVTFGVDRSALESKPDSDIDAADRECNQR